MKLTRLVTRQESIRRMLQRLGEPTEPPPRAPARDPPSYESRVLRRSLSEAATERAAATPFD